MTTGNENVFVGFEAVYATSLQTGVGNVLLGNKLWGVDASNTSHAIVIGYDVTGTASTTTLGSGSSDIRTIMINL